MVDWDGLQHSRGGQLDAARWAALWGLDAPRAFIPTGDKTERRMVLLQWFIMPLVLAGYLIPLTSLAEQVAHAAGAVLVMALHPLFYAALGRAPRGWGDLRGTLLTAADVAVATAVFYLTAARPNYATVLLYCTVALAATRYSPRRALGIASLIALLLTFAALLPLRVALPALAAEIFGLGVLTYLVGLLSQAEKTVGVTAAENARLAETVLQRNRELAALNGLARALNTAATPEDVLRFGIDGMAAALDLLGIRAFVIRDGALSLAAGTASEAAGAPGAPGTAGAAESRRLHEATRAMTAMHTVIKGRRNASGQLSPGPLCSSVPLIVRGACRAVIQADLSAGTGLATEAMLETLEIFCDELAVAFENVLLRGEAHRSAILEEKNRIAQELHDTVLQLLFSIGLRVQVSLDRLPENSPLREQLTEARRLTASAGNELRGAIFTLSSDIAEVGLAAAVERLVAAQAGKAHWTTRVVLHEIPADLPILVQNAAHRVVREALMNAYKHAAASEVMVSVRRAETLMTVLVQDNGMGISAEALAAYRENADHFGLRTVARQIEGLGGDLSIYNDDDGGTVVKAVIPLQNRSARAA